MSVKKRTIKKPSKEAIASAIRVLTYYLRKADKLKNQVTDTQTMEWSQSLDTTIDLLRTDGTEPCRTFDDHLSACLDENDTESVE